jgi:hypothetical protein
MPSVLADSHPAVSPNLTAALILASGEHLRRFELPHPNVKQVLEATGATRSRTDELKTDLLALLPSLERPVGRPKAEPQPAPEQASTVTQEVLSFVLQHPGCAQQHAQRHRYSDAFRAFVIELRCNDSDMSLERFAKETRAPLGTLKDWLHAPAIEADPPPTEDNAVQDERATSGHLQTLLEQWRDWHGDFSAFCKHVRFHLRIPFGRTQIASILEQYGERTPQRRQGRSPDELALRDSFRTFFPGAQWVGDGTPIDVHLNGEAFRFNLELMVDAYSGAFVGLSVRDEEDSTAVIEVFQDAVSTTGAPPIATLLDNRPSNHTPEVEQGLQPALCIYATKRRAQNKAHVEGGFGLFSQRAPDINIVANSPKEIASQVLMLVASTLFRTLNHKPRRSRGGKSRVDLHRLEAPTSEQIEQARAELERRRKQQEKARDTANARQNPTVRKVLDEAFDRLHLEDPKGNIRAAIARYPIAAVIAAIATFEAKRRSGSLPEGVDGRYMLGIARNIAQQDEGFWITERLIRLRLTARDAILAPLVNQRDLLAASLHETHDLLAAFLDHATHADRQIDRVFWLSAVVDHICDQKPHEHRRLLRHAARRIHAAFAIPYKDRLAACRFLAAKVLPLA